MRHINLGFFGFGNIGVGVFKLIEDMKSNFEQRYNLEIEVKKILVKNLNKEREVFVPTNMLTDKVEDIVNDADIDIIVEFLGGEQPAAKYMCLALESGKTVITANKVAFALHWYELREATRNTGAGLYYEAAVCGAIPIINAINGSMQSNRIDRLYGIINGTTNDILSRMTNEGISYDKALAIAQELGLAEPDPISDVEGLDAAYKLSIMASLIFHARVTFNKIFVEGITNISPIDISSGDELGYTLKLLAIAKRNGEKVETRVHPTFIPKEHPLSSINGSMNAVFIHGHACEEMMFMGRGAGSLPTASAVVSDIIRSTAHHSHEHPTFKNMGTASEELAFENNWKCSYYIRLEVGDQKGVLSHVTGCFADKGVSISAMQQKGKPDNDRMPIIFITHDAREYDIQDALAAMNPEIVSLKTMIRVEKHL